MVALCKIVILVKFAIMIPISTHFNFLHNLFLVKM